MTPRARSGFTLVELLVVLGVIGILAGMGFAAFGVLRDGARRKAAAALVQQVAGAISAYGRLSWPLPRPDGAVVQVPAWDANRDQVLDGDPATDSLLNGDLPDESALPAMIGVLRGPLPLTTRDALLASGYRGFAAVTRADLPASALDAAGRVVDPWKRPLRVRHPGRGREDAFGSAGLGIYSLGRDPAVDSDDVRSWR